MATQRSVRTRLTLDVNDYLQGTARAEGATKRFGASAGTVLKGVATGYAAIKLGGLISESVSLEAAYSKTMAQVAVASDAPARKLEELDRLALKMGADTVFSAQDSAAAMLSLAKGGLSPAQIQAGALADTLTLASAGELELGAAADVVVQAMGSFRLGADEANVAVAALAGGANASSASVNDMTQALAQVGTVANSAGFSIQDTTAYLALFANQGFKGSDAGTSLRTMLGRLVPQTNEARDAMRQLGLTYLDSNGNLVDAEEVARRTQDAFSGLSDQQRISAAQAIFGQDAIRGVNALVAEGDEGVRKYTAATSDLAQAQKLADAANSGTAGSMEQLSGAVETAQIQIGKGLAPVVQDLADRASDLVADGDFERWAREGGEAFASFLDEMQPLAESAFELGREALPAVATAGGVVVDVLELAADVITPLVDGFNKLPDAAQQALILAAGAKMLSNRLGPIPGLAGPAGSSLFLFGGRAEDGGKKAGKGAKGYGALATSLKGFAGLTAASFALPSSLDSLDRVIGQISDRRVSGSGLAGSFGKDGKATADTIRELGAAFADSDIGKYASDLDVDMERLATSLSESGSKGEYVTQVLDEYKHSYRDWGTKVGSWIPFIDTDSERATHFRQALEDLAAEYDEVSAKAREQAMAVDERANGYKLLVSGLGQYHDELVRLPTKAVTEITTPGAVKSKKDVLELQERYDLTPAQVETIMNALDLARPVIRAVKKALREVDGDSATVTLTTIQKTIKRSYTDPGTGGNNPSIDKAFGWTGRRVPAGFAGGGIVPGLPPLDPTRDNVLARGATTGEPFLVRSGEWIINEPQSRKNDRWLRLINQGLNLDDLLPGFASGGKYDVSALEVKSQQQRIRDIERDLREKETVGRGRNKRRRYVLRGLDRDVARLELQEARAELNDIRTNAPARKEAKESVVDQFDASDYGSAAGLERGLNRLLADSAAFTLVLADLKAKGASPWLLEQLRKAGPSKASIRVGRQLLADTARLKRINTASAQLSSVGDAYGNLTAGTGTLSAANRSLMVQIQALDVSHVTSEIQRVVRHEIATIGTGAGI